MADEQVKTVRIVIDASKAKEGGAAVEKALQSIDDRMAKLGDSIGSGFSGIKNALLGFLSFDAIMGQIKGLTEAFDRLGSRSRVLGVTTEWMQAFEYAAASASVKLDVAGGALDKWARLVGEADLGSKAAVETLNRLGVNIYDADRKLRPLNDTFVDGAKKLAALEGTAKGSALGVQAMGKEYQRLAPMMGEVAKGSDAMVAAAHKAGAIVGKETVKIWEDLASAADKTMIKWRTFAGENFADSVKTAFEVVGQVVATTFKELQMIVSALDMIWTRAKEFAREQNVAPLRTQLAATNVALGNGQTHLDRQENLLAQQENLTRLAPNDRNRVLLEQQRRETETARTVMQQLRNENYALSEKLISYGVGSPDAPPVPTYPGPPDPQRGGTTGAYGATANDGGASGDRHNKRIQALQAEAAAQKEMAAAALLGAAAVNEEEARFKALQQALEVYGATASAEDPKVKALADSFAKLNKSIGDDKALTAFRLQTKDIVGQNDILAKRLELIDAAPEVVAREIALLQVRNDVAKSGLRLSDEDMAVRTNAVEKQELLNVKLADAQRSQQLWLEPIKSGLSSIQSTAANMWEGILENHKFSLQEFGQLFAKTARRAASELLALATIRPVIGIAVEGLSSMGLVSPNTVRQLGYSSSGGAGGFSMPGGGGGMGGMFDFLSQPITGGSNSAIAGMSMADPFAQGAMQASGSGMLGGLTWGGAAAGIASMGMGAYQMATSKNMAGTIGGGLSMLGGGIGMASMAGMLPMLGAAGGPIGMGLGLAGMLIPMLFGGGGEYKWDPLAGGNATFSPSAGGYSMSERQQLGGKSIGSQFAGVGTTLDALFKAAGGLTDPGKAFSAEIWNNQREGTTSTYLGSPTQGWNQQTYNESGDPAKAVDRLIAKVFYDSVQNNAAMNASPTLRTALGNKEPTSVEQVQRVLSMVDAYDKLGETMSAAETALDAIDDQFQPLVDFATEYGLAMDKIDKEKGVQQLKVYTDFINQVDASAAAASQAAEQFKTLDAAFATFTERAADLGKTIDQIAADKARVYDTMNFNSLQADKAAIYGVNDPMMGSLLGLRQEHDQRVGAAAAVGTGTGAFTELVLSAANVYQVKLDALVGEFVGGFTKQLAALANPMQANLDALKEQHDANVKAAEAIKLVGGDTTALTAVNEAYAATLKKLKDDFTAGLTDALLAIQNPMQATIAGLQKQRDANILAAAALGLVNNGTELYAAQIGKMAGDFIAGLTQDTLGITDPVAAQRAAVLAQFNLNKRDALAIDGATGGTSAFDAATVNYNAKVGQIDKAVAETAKALAETQRGYEAFAKSLASQLVALNDPMAGQIEALKTARDENIRQAEAMTDAATKTKALTAATDLFGAQVQKLAADFVKGLTGQTLAINDPMRAQLSGFRDAYNDNMKAANALFAATGDSSGINAAESLYQTQRQKTSGDFIRSLGDQFIALQNPMRAQLKGLRDQYDANVLAATAIKDAELGTEALTAANDLYAAQTGKIANDFSRGIGTQMVALQSPMAAQIAALSEQYTANHQAAQAIEAVTGRTGLAAQALGLLNAQLENIAKTFREKFEIGALGITDPMRATLTGMANQRTDDLKAAGALGGGASGVVGDYYKLLFNKTANDNNAEIARGLKGMTDPLGVQIDVLNEARDAAMLAAKAINDFAATMGTAMVDTLKVAEYYTKQKADLEKRYFDQTLGGIEDLIKRLTWGDLSNGSPTTMLAGLKGTYEATLGQARAGDLDARSRLAAEASDYVAYDRSYHGSTAEYTQTLQSVRDSLLQFSIEQRGGHTSTNGADSPANDMGPLLQIIASQNEQIAKLAQSVASLTAEVGTLTKQMRRAAA